MRSRVCALSDLPKRAALRIELPDRDIAVVRVGNDVFAVEDVCSHAAFPLSDGSVRRGPRPAIECLLHGSRFDLRTGHPDRPPASEPITVLPVSVIEGDVYVEIES
jgi:3-phenylpropionate/trans-cinnamate dioxygenase ferredoxin subunit